MISDIGAKSLRKELNRGLVGLVLLAVLERAGEDLYGYQIAKQLEGSHPGGSLFKSGSLYPVLRSMSAQGLLTSRIVPSYSGPARRYYRISEQGRRVLAEWTVVWAETRDFVARFTGPA